MHQQWTLSLRWCCKNYAHTHVSMDFYLVDWPIGSFSSLLFTVGLDIYVINVRLKAKRHVMKETACRGMFTKLYVKFLNLRNAMQSCRWLYIIDGSPLFSLIISMITYRKLGGVRVECGRRGSTGQRGVRRRRHPVRRTALAHTCKDGKRIKIWSFFTTIQYGRWS